MIGRLMSGWWAKNKVYVIGYKELWPSLAITAYIAYKVDCMIAEKAEEKKNNPDKPKH